MGLDHLRSWRWLLECGYVPQFAHMTLMRAGFEGAATAIWLVESGEPAERVRRAAIFGLEDLRNRRTFEGLVEARAQREAAERGEQLAPHDWGTGKNGADRYDDRIADMATAGIEAERIPNFTTLLEDHGPGAHVYALTSAFAHRREWAMAFATELDRIEDTGLPGSGALQLEPSAHWAVTITESVMNELETALGAVETHLRSKP